MAFPINYSGRDLIDFLEVDYRLGVCKKIIISIWGVQVYRTRKILEFPDIPESQYQYGIVIWEIIGMANFLAPLYPMGNIIVNG